LPCNCGGEDCACDVIPLGYISEYQTNVQIPIWQTAGITAEEAITAKDNIIAQWSDNNIAGVRNTLKGKIKEIRIIIAGETNSYVQSGEQYILSIKADENQLAGWFEYIFGVEIGLFP